MRHLLLLLLLIAAVACAESPPATPCKDDSGCETGAYCGPDLHCTSSPAQPTLSAINPVTSGSVATATVTAHAGMTYDWTISGGAAGAGGAAGVTSAGKNTFTWTAGSVGT